MSDLLANLFAQRFIARKDVKAIQHADGSWSPHTKNGKRDGERLPWTRADLVAHLDGSKTLGHYLLDSDDTCKLFAFDVDLEKFDPTKEQYTYLPTQAMDPDDLASWQASFVAMDAREAWRQRGFAGRDFMKVQFRTIAHRLCAAVEKELQIPVAAAYSGNKGIHVYGFTGLIPAADARLGAQIVLDSLGDWKPSRGTNFYKCTNTDPVDGCPNLSIEVFPKQDSLDGKDLGNLMRLPLGRNQKTPDPTFFIDMTKPMNDLSPVAPERALSGASPFAL
jgi:hypothetical protein